MRIGFVTCADLSRYRVSKQNPLYTHDDQIAADFLLAQGCDVVPIVWGEPVEQVKKKNLDVLVVRSPWDYSDSEENRASFLAWLQELNKHSLPLANPFPVLRWNLDKHYLQELENSGVSIPPTILMGPQDTLEVLDDALAKWGKIVVKPCISAGARDTFLFDQRDALRMLQPIRCGRTFMVQPFLPAISDVGEWSLVFLNQEYSHAVLKLPKKGHWLVQDELGGSVQCLEAPNDIREFAQATFEKAQSLLQTKFGSHGHLLYARVDILPGCVLGELELLEPELFFRDHIGAVQKFHQGLLRLTK